MEVPLEIPLGEEWEDLPLEPGKSEPQIVQWVQDFDGLIRRNKERILGAIQADVPDLQERLEKMVDRMKNIWRVAKEDQKSAWNEVKRQSFDQNELATKLIDVICSFESRWIPHEHCACPICWEEGLSQKLSNLPDFVNHMKNAHHVGWKNVKDYWCMIFTRALGKLVYRRCISDAPGKLDIEMGNAFAWCPYPKCKHTHDKGSSFIRYFEKEHHHKTVPAMGIWAAMVERIKQHPDVNVGQFLNERSGYACSKCGFFAISQRSVEDHCGMKHRNGEAQCIPCHSQPAIRPGEGEGDDPTLKMKTDILLKQAEPKNGEWTKEEAEETGRQWHRMIMAQWQQGVQEKQISREESRRIRKDGGFPIFINNSIVPMWKAWKGVSFAAIQGLHEMSIQIQRTKMREMKNSDLEMYGPRRKLDGKQLEDKIKAPKAARKTHQIIKWTNLVGDVLNWRISDLIGREVETQMNEGSPMSFRSRDRCSDKKKESLIKCMNALRSLIAPYDPEDAQNLGEDTVDEDGENNPVQPKGVKFVPKAERIQKICDGMLQGPQKIVDTKTEEERRAEETEKRNRQEE
jgi:hypothetical protein